MSPQLAPWLLDDAATRLAQALIHFLWQGSLIGLVAAAALAALLYVIDDARGMPVGFIANRNALLATVFGVLSLIAHDRWRRDGWHSVVVVVPFCLLLALLSAEAGTGAAAMAATARAPRRPRGNS